LSPGEFSSLLYSANLTASAPSPPTLPPTGRRLSENDVPVGGGDDDDIPVEDYEDSSLPSEWQTFFRAFRCSISGLYQVPFHNVQTQSVHRTDYFVNFSFEVLQYLSSTEKDTLTEVEKELREQEMENGHEKIETNLEYEVKQKIKDTSEMSDTERSAECNILDGTELDKYTFNLEVANRVLQTSEASPPPPPMNPPFSPPQLPPYPLPPGASYENGIIILAAPSFPPNAPTGGPQNPPPPPNIPSPYSPPPNFPPHNPPSLPPSPPPSPPPRVILEFNNDNQSFIDNVSINIQNAAIVQTNTYYILELRGSGITVGDYIILVSKNYTDSQPDGAECNNVWSDSEFSRTNEWRNLVDGPWDNTTQDYGGQIHTEMRYDTVTGTMIEVKISDLVLINDGPDTINPLNTSIENHQPQGTYFICYGVNQGNSSRRRMTSTSDICDPINTTYPCLNITFVFLGENSYIVAQHYPPSSPPPLSPPPKLPPLPPPKPPPSIPPPSPPPQFPPISNRNIRIFENDPFVTCESNEYSFQTNETQNNTQHTLETCITDCANIGTMSGTNIQLEWLLQQNLNTVYLDYNLTHVSFRPSIFTNNQTLAPLCECYSYTFQQICPNQTIDRPVLTYQRQFAPPPSLPPSSPV
tara:strand:- start:3607 stop:5523 length:1917 start_codon:yes stop_codon:yes gene_type:complete